MNVRVTNKAGVVTGEDTGSQTGSTEGSTKWTASDIDSMSSQIKERPHPDIPDYVFQPEQGKKQRKQHKIPTPTEDINVQARTPRMESLDILFG